MATSFLGSVGKIQIVALTGVTETEFNRALQMFSELGAGEQPGTIQLSKEGTANIVRIATGQKETADGIETLRGMFQEHVFANKTTILEDWNHDPDAIAFQGEEEEDDDDDDSEEEEEEEDDEEDDEEEE
ncbi:hypothetical protein [Leptospira idonii]|uniref:Uncharacterized protein n=1 Tax=Leptospira idonii TaxID=1193500 RepID=A0A4R9LZP9_9LEPT|nr:hypothetical protein [Leptospira idonii]TGN18975.1 hypothetical protein EHS15_11220 [Leptospira idonii]